ncbi:hypothetical protein MLD38_000200 [Melastoma candidum]|uniref:Uncharacterized protein n=1 Tax=Melastoma candidum TaxID=119954 RepID=A0ACB9SE83_9MYRT|nr:hypothetical protein MLD38_000200 [Melastoma candidum]
MSGESKDSAIKLFGKTIPLADAPMGVRSDVDDDDDDDGKGGGDYEVVGKVREEGRDEERERDEGFEEDDYVDSDDEARETSSGARGVDSGAKREDESRLVNLKEVSSSDSTTAAGVSSKADEEQSTSDLGQKVLKKPDKILPCPRCNSMETKFCYYNNYNVNQPRHFCKNCQRYWTAGGTMRNVPVGAGRRKSKSASPASNGRHVTIPEGVQIPNGFNHSPLLKTNGTILTFGPTDTRLCESMASVLRIGENSLINCTQNGFHKPEEVIIPVTCRNGENGGDIGTQAGGLRPDRKRENDAGLQNSVEIPPQMPCFPGSPWPYPPLPPPATAVAATSPTSPSLGKHSRDENMVKPDNSCVVESPTEDNSEKCLWVPKTLRIDDPREAAKSSIWATLGIEDDIKTGHSRPSSRTGKRGAWWPKLRRSYKPTQPHCPGHSTSMRRHKLLSP